MAALGLCLLATGCAFASVTTTSFRATADLETTAPRTRAENGLGRPLLPPPDLGWRISLAGVADDPPRGAPSYRYELDLLLEDRRPGAVDADLVPLLDGAELVDDQVRRFRATRMAWLDADAKTQKRDRADGVLRRRCVVVFDLPAGYVFRHVVRCTVHWGLRVSSVDGAGTPARDLYVSTRFEQ